MREKCEELTEVQGFFLRTFLNSVKFRVSSARQIFLNGTVTFVLTGNKARKRLRGEYRLRG